MNGIDSIYLCAGLEDTDLRPIVNRCSRPVHKATDAGEQDVLQFVHGSVAFSDKSNKVTVLCLLILQMLIFSLGRVLQRAVKNTDMKGGKLEAVLESMVHLNPAVRASLMDLFDVSTTVIPIHTDADLTLRLPD